MIHNDNPSTVVVNQVALAHDETRGLADMQEVSDKPEEDSANQKTEKQNSEASDVTAESSFSLDGLDFSKN